MCSSRMNLLFVVAIAVAPPVFAQQVRLERAFRDGTKYTTTTESKMSQTLAIAGTEIKSSNQQSVTTSTEVGRRDSSGSVQVRRKIVGAKAKLNFAGEEIEVDSATLSAGQENDHLESFAQIFRGMLGAQWTELRGKDNRVTSVSGSLDQIERVPEAAQTAVRDQLDPENLKQSANREMDKLPAKPVAKGDRWSVVESQNLGEGQKMIFNTSYKYEGASIVGGKPLDKISFTHKDVKFVVDPSGGLGLQIKQCDLKVTESAGEMLFDRQRGEVVYNAERVKIEGDLVFSAGGRDVPGVLNLSLDNRAETKHQ